MVSAADWKGEAAELQKGQLPAQPGALGSRTATSQVLGGVPLDQDTEIQGFRQCRKAQGDEKHSFQLSVL